MSDERTSTEEFVIVDDELVEHTEGLIRDFPGRERLTPREQEVVSLIAAGAANKQVGRELGISPRTVEVHRARIMEKLGARNAADLVRIVFSEKPRTASA